MGRGPSLPSEPATQRSNSDLVRYEASATSTRPARKARLGISLTSRKCPWTPKQAADAGGARADRVGEPRGAGAQAPLRLPPFGSERQRLVRHRDRACAWPPVAASPADLDHRDPIPVLDQPDRAGLGVQSRCHDPPPVVFRVRPQFYGGIEGAGGAIEPGDDQFPRSPPKTHTPPVSSMTNGSTWFHSTTRSTPVTTSVSASSVAKPVCIWTQSTPSSGPTDSTKAASGASRSPGRWPGRSG